MIAFEEVSQNEKYKAIHAAVAEHLWKNWKRWLYQDLTVYQAIRTFVLCQSKDFSRTMTLSGSTFLWPCVCKCGLYIVNPKHHVKHSTWLSEYWYTKAISLPFFRQVLAATLYIRRQKTFMLRYILWCHLICVLYMLPIGFILLFLAFSFNIAPYRPCYHSAD